MQTLKNLVGHSIQIDLHRDQCPVIARTESDLATIKKQFTKLNRHLHGMALPKNQAVDPAIALKRSRYRRGLTRLKHKPLIRMLSGFGLNPWRN